jgi:hypothetical protein
MEKGRDADVNCACYWTVNVAAAAGKRRATSAVRVCSTSNGLRHRTEVDLELDEITQDVAPGAVLDEIEAIQAKPN